MHRLYVSLKSQSIKPHTIRGRLRYQATLNRFIETPRWVVECKRRPEIHALIVGRQGRGERIGGLRLDGNAPPIGVLGVDVVLDGTRQNGEVVVRIGRIAIDIPAVIAL